MALTKWIVRTIAWLQEEHRMRYDQALNLATEIDKIIWITYYKNTECYRIQMSGGKRVTLPKERITNIHRLYMEHKPHRMDWK